VRRSRDRRTRIIFWIISLMVVTSMGLGMAVTFTPPRITPTPTPTLTPVPPPTRTPTAS